MSLQTLPAERISQVLLEFGAILMLTVMGLIFLEYKALQMPNSAEHICSHSIIRFQDIRDERGAMLTGSWQGRGLQEQGPENEPFEFPIKFKLRVQDCQVHGTGSAHFKLIQEEIEAFFEVYGGFVHGRFLKLDYRNSDGSVIQFGSLLLTLDDGGKLLTGTLVGYGFKSKRPVSVEIQLTKAKN